MGFIFCDLHVSLKKPFVGGYKFFVEFALFSQIKENILNRIFILLLGSCPRGGTWGAGGSKTLAWGFAMAPHRLRILVLSLND